MVKISLLFPLPSGKHKSSGVEKIVFLYAS
jgi:hypothetical protein